MVLLMVTGIIGICRYFVKSEQSEINPKGVTSIVKFTTVFPAPRENTEVPMFAYLFILYCFEETRLLSWQIVSSSVVMALSSRIAMSGQHLEKRSITGWTEAFSRSA